MRLPVLRRSRSAEPGVVTGTVRLDRRTKRLVGRLRPGEVAVIDHVDLDRVAADSLVAVGVAAVLNAKPSISGRYPNLGPEVLVQAGVPLLDDLGEALFERLREGDVVRVEADTVYLNGQPVASGTRQDAETIRKAMIDAREGLSVQLEAFDYQDDLEVLRPYIREFKPVLIGVDGGADALVEGGYSPDIIIGDMDSVSDDVLRCGAEVIVHAYPDGRAPGLTRVNELGVTATTFPAAATSEDIAMLLADEKGASLIVAVGTHATLGEFLDKGRGGMASTFLTRLKIGGKLVDAKGVSKLYRQNISGSSLLLLILSAIAAMTSAVAVSTVGKAYLGLVSEWWNNLLFQIQRLF